MPDADDPRAPFLALVNKLSYPPSSGETRDDILKFVRKTPLVHDLWNHFKQLFKKALADPNADATVLATLIHRIETERNGTYKNHSPVDLGNLESVVDCRFIDDYLFVIGSQHYWSGKSLAVFKRNPANPLKPIPIGSAELASPQVSGVASVIFAIKSIFVRTLPEATNSTNVEVSRMALCGNYLCYVIATSSRSEQKFLQVVDVSDPANPQFRGTLAFKKRIALCPNPQTYPYLCLIAVSSSSRQEDELCVVDLSNPDNPTVSGRITVPELNTDTSSIAITGSKVLVSIGSRRDAPASRGLRIFEVSPQGYPSSVSDILFKQTTAVACYGSLAYLGVQSHLPEKNGLQVLDISDLSNVRELGFCAFTGYAQNLTISPDGNYVYLTGTYRQKLTIDVRDSAHPKRTGTIDSTDAPVTLAISDTLAYAPTGYRGTRLISLIRPDRPHLVGDAPNGETIGYMKRLGRRFLRQLAKTNPARYAEIATELLLLQTGTEATIDPAKHWATLDILFGGGTRFRQTKHGRGRYILTGQPTSRLALRTREDRFPEAWNTRPDLLIRLLNTPGLLPPIQTFAARALRATRNVFPTLSDTVLEQWLASTEPLLVALGVKLVTKRLLAGESLPPKMTADAFFKASATVRRTLTQTQGGSWASKKVWAETFALRLAEHLRPIDRLSLNLSRRQIAGGILLSRYFAWAIGTRHETVSPLIAAFLASGRPELLSLIVATAEKINPLYVLSWLISVARVPDPEQREATLQGLAVALKSVPLVRSAVRDLVFSFEPAVREMGWLLIAASATTRDVLQGVWKELLQYQEPTDALITAMASTDALGLLERAGIGAAEFAAYSKERPFLISLLSPETFGTLATTAAPSLILNFVGVATDEHWQRLRPVWLRLLGEGIGTNALWFAAEEALDTDNTGQLESRLLGDPQIAETFLMVDDDRLLEIREPAFAVLLGRWVQRYADKFTRNSRLLFQAATHPLPEVRIPSLARVQELGMDMPFALRLLESAVPPSMAVGKSFFDAEPRGGDHEFDYGLALCDSPHPDVRTIGIQYLQERWDTVDIERVLSALFENPAPAIQAFVTVQLAGTANRPVATPLFDAEVLRTTNRARVAKERIKVRQTLEPTLDVATLLTVARGRTPRDAEWAIAELARRVASGETIEGIQVEGVIGI